jgi:hypothetical protein
MCAQGKNEATARIAVVLPTMLAFGGVASAEPESVRVDYVAPVGCPDAAAFMQSLRGRTTLFREARPDEPAREFLVRVRAEVSAFSGRLEIRSRDGRAAIRNVDAKTCDEITAALALITALTIDPNAATPRAKVPSRTEAEPPPGPATAADGKASLPSAAVVATPAAVAPEPASPWRWSAGLLGHATFWLSPTMGYGGDVFVEAEAPVSSGLGPAARLGLFLNQADVDSPTGASARFQWALMQVEGCPVRLGSATLALHPCLALRLGLIHAEGRQISQPRETIDFWSDAGPVLRLRLAATAELLVEAQVGLMFPLHRTTFDIVDMGAASTVYSVPRVGGTVAIGVARRFR